jgi:hypothetical protein
MKHAGIFLAAVLCVLTVLSWEASTRAEEVGDVVVVVNKNNGAKILRREDLRPLFQTTKTEWADGTTAVPVNLPEADPLRQAFDRAVLGLDPDRIERYWIDRKIRGGERPPRKVTTAGAVLRVVAADKGGVGYVAAADVNDSVRVVARIRRGEVVSP